MRIIFAGCPAIAVPCLEALFSLTQGSKEYELAGIITNPDTPKGRSKTLLPTEIGLLAAEQLCVAGFSQPLLLKPEKLDAAVRDQISLLKPDLLVSFAYGKIFGPKFLALFSMGGINIHPSLLPKYRGPTPIPAAISGRETETGITIQKLASEMDTGDILLQEHLALCGNETTGSLSKTMAQLAARMLPEVLKGLSKGVLHGIAQKHEDATYCSLIEKNDGRIDWNKSAAEIDAQIRAFDPWPQTWAFHRDQQLFVLKAKIADLSIIDSTQAFIPSPQSPVSSPPGTVLGIDKKQGILVQTGEGVLALTELQYHAKKALHWKDFLNGARNFIGSKLI